MMKRLLSITGIISLVAISLTSCEKNSESGNSISGRTKPNDLNTISYVSQPVCGGDLHADLFAGKDARVGEIIVSLSEASLKVEFKADEGWVFTKTHLSVTRTLEEVPANEGGNPMIGLFEYYATHDPAVARFLYQNIPADDAGNFYILAHAEVNPVLKWTTDLEIFNGSLPETAEMKVQYPYAGSTSYLKTTITNGGILDGTYNSWCIDIDNVIYNNMNYPVKAISSYDPDFSNLGLVDKPQNMNMVNWILNQDYPGKTAPDMTVYTYGDVQRAIWELLEDNYSESGLGLWSRDRVNNILEESSLSGENFVPQCGDNIAVVLVPADLTQPFQITLAQVGLTAYPSVCEPVYGNSETAWAAGYDFGGNSWAKYFTFCISN